MTFDKISRRRVLQGTAALTLGTGLPLRRAIAAETTVGFIYVGSRDDYGYNQAHAAGAAALKRFHEFHMRLRRHAKLVSIWPPHRRTFALGIMYVMRCPV